MDAKPLAARLRKARENAGFKSASDAARKIGVNTVTYTGHENGTREFDRRLAAMYAEKFGVDPAWLLLGIESKEEPVSENLIKEVDMRDADKALPSWGIPDGLIRDRLFINPSKALMFEAVGDAAYDPARPNFPGSIFPGDKVLIDTEDRHPSPPGLFAIKDGAGFSIKLIEMIPLSSPQSLRLSSVSPMYSSFEVKSSDVNIVGRVRGKFSVL
jgi:phage repressor protein C with HTH and peptisase S24 domain